MVAPARVLVVDDDEAIRESLRFLLEGECGYAVAEAEDGARALAYLRAAVEPCVVLLDLVMPRASGMEVLRALADDRAVLARARFVLLSARHAPLPEADGKLLARLGVTRLLKPFEVDDLLATVRAAADDLSA